MSGGPALRAPPRYQAFFCEENVWWLARDAARLGARPRWAVFVSNRGGRCALWMQRLAPAGQPVLWDYHVVLAVGGAPCEVWDLDTRLGAPVPLSTWMAATFRPLAPGFEHLAPRFRVVPAATLLERFSSDRRHMRDAHGAFLQPPPPWPAPVLPGQGSNLARFLDPDDPIAGVVVGLEGLAAALAG